MPTLMPLREAAPDLDEVAILAEAQHVFEETHLLMVGTVVRRVPFRTWTFPELCAAGDLAPSAVRWLVSHPDHGRQFAVYPGDTVNFRRTPNHGPLSGFRFLATLKSS